MVNIVFYFRQVPLLSDAQITDVMEVSIQCIFLALLLHADGAMSSTGIVQVLGRRACRSTGDGCDDVVGGPSSLTTTESTDAQGTTSSTVALTLNLP